MCFALREIPVLLTRILSRIWEHLIIHAFSGTALRKLHKKIPFAMRAYKACLPRMQLPQQFLLHVLMLLFFFLGTLGQNSVQKFVWEFRTDVSEPFPWALRCVYRLKFVSFPSFHRLIYRHVTTSVLSLPLRIWPLGTILVLLLTTWWPFRRAVNHLLH